MSFDPNAPTPQWAAEFDAWTADALARRDVDALMKYRETAPGVLTLAQPTFGILSCPLY